MHEIALVLVGFVVAFIGTMSGGGAGLLTLFTLIAFGLPTSQAIATNKFGDLGFFLPAVRNFSRAKQIKKKYLPAIITINILGVTLGTLALTHINADFLRKIIAVVLLLIVFISLKKPNYASTERRARKPWPFVYFLTSISSGALGAGTGILSTMTLMYFRGLTALQAMAHSFYANSIGAVISLGILVFADLINYKYGLCLLVGNIIGAHFGSKLAIKKGNNFVRVMTAVLAVTVAIQLLVVKSK
ncbi:MAG TPA: TSUP family transporter [Candidatus Saccharimonadales bacterium]